MNEIVVPCIFNPNSNCFCINREGNLALFEEAGGNSQEGLKEAIDAWQLSEKSPEAARVLRQRFPVRFGNCTAYGMADIV